MTFPDINTADGRRGAAFLAILGGCIVFTVFAAVGVYLVRSSAGLSFWLALAAHAQILIGMSALGALLVKRSIKISRAGVEVDDKDEAAQTVADAAQARANEVKE